MGFLTPIGLESGPEGVVLSAHPTGDEIERIGWVIDLFTPTGLSDRLGPAVPDANGDIVRVAGPGVTLSHVEQVLARMGCQPPAS